MNAVKNPMRARTSGSDGKAAILFYSFYPKSAPTDG